jgi:polysaccharide biosynthesis protein PslH
MACEGIDVTPGKNVLFADSPREFVEQIQRLRNDATLRVNLGREARKFVVDHYSWPVIGQNLSAIYKRLTRT